VVDADADSDSRLAPYERLLELARAAETLILDDRYPELGGVFAERNEIVSRLPARPPLAAAWLLAETRRVVLRTELLLRTGLDASERSLLALDNGRRAVAGYAGSAVPGVLDASV
jgi:hypothetical protein